MAYGIKETRVLGPREHYAADFALVIKQLTDSTETTLEVRRVKPAGQKQEELQIEIKILKIGKKRDTHTYSSFILPPALADQLAEACAKLREPA